MLTGIFLLFLFLLIGEGVSLLIGGFLPGSIIGMLLLFAALQLRIVKEEPLERVVGFFMKYMPILFLPSAVGLMVSIPLIKHQWVGIVCALVLSTVAVLLSVGWSQQWMNRKRIVKEKDEHPSHLNPNL